MLASLEIGHAALCQNAMQIVLSAAYLSRTDSLILRGESISTNKPDWSVLVVIPAWADATLELLLLDENLKRGDYNAAGSVVSNIWRDSPRKSSALTFSVPNRSG